IDAQKAGPPATLSVGGLKIVDTAGVTRAGMEVEADGTVAVRTFAANGAPAGYIRTDAAGDNYTTLSAPNGQPGVYIQSDQDYSTVSVLASQNNARAVLYVDSNGMPALFLKDAMER